MIYIDLDYVHVPVNLSGVVENSIQRAKAQEKKDKRVRGHLITVALAILCFAVTTTSLSLNAVVVFAQQTIPTISLVVNQPFYAYYQKTYAYQHQLIAIENDYFSNDILIATSEYNGLRITLINYYIDKHEACFEYIVTGMNLDKYASNVILASKRELNILSSNGETQAWVLMMDPEARISSRTFPGGLFYLDEKNSIYEYVAGGNDFGSNTTLRKIDNGTTTEDTYSLIVEYSFRKPITIGDTIETSFTNMIFIKKASEMGIEEGIEENIFEQIDGEWSFKIIVDERFKSNEQFQYEVVNAEAGINKGITLEDVSISPLVTKLVFSVDYSKNDIADPNNITIVSEPQYVYKINLMNFTEAVRIEFDDQSYGFYSAYRIKQENGVDFYELTTFSLYFEDIDSFSIVITERNGNVTVLEIVKIEEITN